MIVFIDTNILYNNWHFENANFKYLINFLENTNSELIVSDVVCDEIENKFNKELEILKKSFKDSIKRSKSLLKIEPSFDFKKLDYKYSIRDIISEKTQNVKFIPYNSIENTKIVERAIKKVKPFQDQDKGYRDTLIWLSFLEYLKNNCPYEDVLFINNNSKDFFDGKNQNLHQDLLEDVSKFGLKNNFRIYNSIRDFIDKEVDMKQNKYSSNQIMEEFIYPNENLIEQELEYHINSQTSNWFQQLLKNSVGELTNINYLIDFEIVIIEGIEDPDLMKWSIINDNDFFAELYFNLRIVDLRLTIPTIVYKNNKNFFDTKFYDIESNDENTFLKTIRRIHFNISFNFIVDDENITDIVINSFEAK
jgi:hypothetical protein